MAAISLYIVSGIAVLSLLAYLVQERLLSKPEKLKADFHFQYDIPFNELFFDPAPGVRINGLHFYRREPKGLILYLHGNSRSIIRSLLQLNIQPRFTQ